MNDMNCARGKLFLAPMAGYTDLPFRLLCKEYGADITVSEMISAKGLYYNDQKTRTLMQTAAAEDCFGLQIFGSEPDILRHAASELCRQRTDPDSPVHFDFLDFNTGCPAPKIVKNGDGSALLKNPSLFSRCIEAIVRAADVPVSVKMRKGFEDGENRILELSKAAEDAGASLLTVHGRTRSEYYAGHSDWEAAAQAAQNTSIPVILSGDVNSPEDAERAMRTGAAGLMIGRAAVSNPLIFRQIKTYFDTGSYAQITAEEKIAAALRHIDLALEYKAGKYAMIELRKHLAGYTKGMADSAAMRTAIFKLTEPQDAKEVFLKALEQNGCHLG